jgi:PBP1b-binding outer membrane lipoprotein LpoB
MKKVILIILSASLIVACSSKTTENDSIRNTIREYVEKANSVNSGTDIDEITSCEKITFENDNVYYHHTIDESKVRIELLRGSRELIQEELINIYKNTYELKDLVENVRSIDGKFIYIYTGSITGDTMRFEI